MFKAPEIFEGTIAFSPDSRTLATASLIREGPLRLWDLDSGELKHTLTGLGSYVGSIAFSPDGQFVLSGSHGGKITMWDTSSGTKKFTIKQLDDVSSISLSPSGTILASISSQRSMNLWDMSRCGSQQDNEDERTDLKELVISPNQNFVASKTGPKITLWDSLTGKSLHSLLGYVEYDNLVFSSDSQVIAAWCEEGLRIWPTSTGELMRVLEFDWEEVLSTLSADGTQMASGFERNITKVLDFASNERLGTIRRDDKAAMLAFSPNKKLLAASQGEGISVWDNISRTLLFTVQPWPTFYRHINSLAFSPDSKLIASCCPETLGEHLRLSIWDTASGNELYASADHCEWTSFPMEHQLRFTDDRTLQTKTRSYTIDHDKEDGSMHVFQNDSDINVSLKWVDSLHKCSPTLHKFALSYYELVTLFYRASYTFHVHIVKFT